MRGAAAAYCSSLDAGGLVPGWQLPTLPQLWSLVEVGKNPTIDTGSFPGTVEQPYWTSDSAGGGTGNSWVVNFGGGYAVSDADTNLSAIRCVFSGSADAGH